MNARYWQTQGWAGDLVAFFAGTLMTISLAPYSYWPLGLLAVGVLSQLFTGLKGAKAFVRSAFFGLGMFASGASWVHVSISSFGNTNVIMATLLTSLFVIGLSLVFATPFYFYTRFLQSHRFGFVLGFPAAWVIGEWIRTWFLTGFPWLFLGYGHHSTWLSGWAPIFGVLGVSFLGVFTAVALFDAFNRFVRSAIDAKPEDKIRFRVLSGITVCAVISVWVAGYQLQKVKWTTQNPNPITATLVQPNIAQEKKWNPAYADTIFDTLLKQTENFWSSDIVIWPEAAIPFLFHDSSQYFEEIQNKIANNQTGFITGILYDDIENQKYYNSIIGLGGANGRYDKQRLVPFGEYVPLENQLRGLINFFNLPMSIIHKGYAEQELLSVKNFHVATSICYEVVYPSLVAKYARDAGLIITISNDAWFGDSIGPIQHFEMARMRALENQKYVLRVANTGITGVIKPDASIQASTDQFVRTELHEIIYLSDGLTPFAKWQSWPIVIFSFFIMLTIAIWQKAHGRNNA